VREHREADAGIARRQLRGGIERQFEMHAGIVFGMEFDALRHAVQRIDFGKDHAQRAAGTQHAQEHARPRLAERAAQFLEHALRHQMRGFAVGDHLPHQQHGFRRDAKPERRIPRGKTGHAQDAYRVFGEGLGDMAKHPRLEIAHAAEGIDQHAVVALRDGIDGEVAAAQIVFQRDRSHRTDDEAAITATALAFGAGERVFLALVCGCRNTGKSRPTGWKPAASIASGVAPTTT
jgi:hypothetical protein